MDDSTRRFATPYVPYVSVRARRPHRTRDAERWDEILRLLAEDLAALDKHGAGDGKNENVEATS